MAHNYRLESIMGVGEREPRQQNLEHLVTFTIKSRKITNVYIYIVLSSLSPFLHNLGPKPRELSCPQQARLYNSLNISKTIPTDMCIGKPI